MTRLPLVAAWLGSLACAGCVSLPDFADESHIDGPRVLAVVAEPPEAAPGQDVNLSVLVAGTTDYSVGYRACPGIDTNLGGSQYEARKEPGCSGNGSLELGSGPQLRVPGALTQPFFDDLAAAQHVFGAALPAQTLELLRTRLGVPIQIDAEVHAQDRTIHAIKRVLLSDDPQPNHNPPPPKLTFGGEPVAAATDAPFTCRSLSGEPLQVEPGDAVELAPSVDAESGDETWLESYEVLNASGTIEQRTERAFYSWFANAGHFARGLTRAPLRNQVWTAPAADGCVTLWLVVRDGHGGASACGLQVAVGAAQTCD